MKRLLSSLAIAVGAWVLVSFGGAMIDPAHAGLWTQSLMASLLTSLVLAPLLFVLRQRNEADVRTDATAAQTKAANQTEEPFVDEDAGRMRTLWPQDDSEDRQQAVSQQSRQLA
jgi:hypothetical protein